MEDSPLIAENIRNQTISKHGEYVLIYKKRIDQDLLKDLPLIIAGIWYYLKKVLVMEIQFFPNHSHHFNG